MPKYWITGQLTLVSDTFGQKVHKNNNRKDIYVHSLDIVLDPTNYAEAVADKPILQAQLTTKSESAIVPLSAHCKFRLHDALIDIEHDVAGTDIDYVAFLRTKLSWQVQFKVPRRLTAVEDVYFGFKSIFAGQVSFAMLVSEKNVS